MTLKVRLLTLTKHLNQNYCRDDYLFVIDLNGKIVNKHIISYELADASMENSMTYKFLSDTLLEFKERKIKREYNEDE